MKIGVLALQGAVIEHLRMLEQAGAEAVAVKKREQLQEVDGLIIPGGESTTISKLMHKYGFMEDVRQFPAEQKPLFGTCAGAILLANRISGQAEAHLGVMDIKVERNGFGRQKDSFEAILPIADVGPDFPAVFIRAPYIMEVGESVQVLAKYDQKIVAARQGLCLACAFHPELTEDYRFHRYFLEMVKEYRA
ncbi:pyridoxal 5'-phosphate synthase glutaminase subunit PdxT [Brevibacillus humidisoli]|uniref:pyridoxal 5'-phosphate synthase glutaminase subunit PdxT n=1 Tax=Brevibacillus humidisoli TaxID=2895522 RepID=UPI001E4157D4|nr:pyridoxal 5'-phosphate synthase glutaminase subunit PdxT [Brevibacillus humidisoli]UFJ40465.1 pyridoxal 5'-phosphate synthase glutaminase subunit PdxT [Brevibacillus humidisoli]